MQIARKITAAVVLAGTDWKKQYEDGNGKPTKLFVVMGEAKGIEADKSAFGDFDRFTGIFEATRASDGAVYQAAKVIFPPPTDFIVKQSFLDARVLKDDKGEPILDEKGKPQIDPNASVRFAFVIGAEQHSRTHADGKVEHKYRFTCEPVDGIGTARADPFADMRAAVQAALPAPAAAPAIEDKTADKAGKTSS